LGAETTPTLCCSIPAFCAFIQRWTDLMEENPDWETIILPGLDKLSDYEGQLTPSYVVAMGKIQVVPLFTILHYFYILTAIDPANKLSFYHREDPEDPDSEDPEEEFNKAKKMFLKAVS
jgi:hypothetical protein